MTKLAPEWVRTSDPVIRSPAHYRWTTAPALTDDERDDVFSVQWCSLFVCWNLTSLCHSNGHIETMPAREINPFTALTRIRSQFNEINDETCPGVGSN